MEPTTKFIIFANENTKCLGGEESIVKRLKLGYRFNSLEHAIGVTCDKAERIVSYSDDYDIFLFEDANQRPTKKSVFISNFLKEFYARREDVRFLTVFHDSSRWNFESYFRADGSLNPDFALWLEELTWQRDLRKGEFSIRQSHIPDDVYCMELDNVAAAIISHDSSAYFEALDQLRRRFGDPLLEEAINLLQGICAGEINKDRPLKQYEADVDELLKMQSLDPFDPIYREKFEKLRDRLGIQ